MSGFKVTESFAYPPARVWDLLVNFDRATEWMNGIDSFSLDGPLQIGSKISFESRGAVRHSEITELIPGQRIALTSVQGPVTATYTYSLEQTEGGTMGTLEAVCKAKGPMKIIMPLINWLIKRTDGNQLADLNKLIKKEASIA